MTSWLPGRPRSLLIFLPFLVAIVFVVAWSAFWYRAAQVTDATVAAWIEREATAGRVYTCAARSVGGYPFRIEHRCSEPIVDLQGPGASLRLKAQEIRAVAQIYQPRLIIAEIAGPLLVEESGRALATADWRLAQASLRGSPSAPERLSVVIDGARLNQPETVGRSTWAVAERLEFHTRVDPASAANRPALDFAIRLNGAAAPFLNFLAAPANADVSANLRGLADLRPKPIAARLKELQAAGGRLEIVRARVERDGSVGIASGELRLSAMGRLDGLLTVTMTGLGRGGLGLGGAELGLALLGKPAELEGKQAIVLPLRFNDGAVFLGALSLGRLPPLY